MHLLLLACGDIGTRVGLRMLEHGWRVTAARRTVDALPAEFDRVSVDLLDPESVKALADIPADYVLFTPTPTSRSEAGYREMFETGLGNILQYQNRDCLRRWFMASSTSVYGQNGDDWVDERSPTRPTAYSGRAVLAAEQALADDADASTVLRFGGIYGPGRERQLQMVREGRCSEDGEAFSNRIHSEDCAAAFEHLLLRAAAGERVEPCYVAVDNQPSKIGEVQSWIAEQLGVEYRCAEGSKRRVGSKRCSNQLLRNSGWSPEYPSYQEGYGAMIEAMKLKDDAPGDH